MGYIVMRLSAFFRFRFLDSSNHDVVLVAFVTVKLCALCQIWEFRCKNDPLVVKEKKAILSSAFRSLYTIPWSGVIRKRLNFIARSRSAAAELFQVALAVKSKLWRSASSGNATIPRQHIRIDDTHRILEQFVC
jgi:hypothetical protein